MSDESKALELAKPLEVVQPAAIPTRVFQPVMSIEEAVAHRKLMVQFVKEIMVEGLDFGIVPGTSNEKPTLFKPGAEKLVNFFGLETEYITIREVMDMTGVDHGDELFYYVGYRCVLTKNKVRLGLAEGSCNSWESKYRYRMQNRVCPFCGQETILKSKHDDEGWFCWKKRGGCGATFDADNYQIIDQRVGRVPNPDIADSINAIQKIGQKRALVSAVLLATSASEFFVPDLEDLEQPTGQRNTPEQQAELAQRRIKETAAAAPASTEPAKPEIRIPGPIKALYELISSGAKGSVGKVFDIMKASLIEASPRYGETEYRRIIDKSNAKYTGVKSGNQYWEAVLEIWDLAEQYRADARKAAGGYQATNDDVPLEDEPAGQLELVKGVTK